MAKKQGISEKVWNKIKKTVSPYIPEPVKEFVKPVTKVIDNQTKKTDENIKKFNENIKKVKQSPKPKPDNTNPKKRLKIEQNKGNDINYKKYNYIKEDTQKKVNKALDEQAERTGEILKLAATDPVKLYDKATDEFVGGIVGFKKGLEVGWNKFQTKRALLNKNEQYRKIKYREYHQIPFVCRKLKMLGTEIHRIEYHA